MRLLLSQLAMQGLICCHARTDSTAWRSLISLNILGDSCILPTEVAHSYGFKKASIIPFPDAVQQVATNNTH